MLCNVVKLISFFGSVISITCRSSLMGVTGVSVGGLRHSGSKPTFSEILDPFLTGFEILAGIGQKAFVSIEFSNSVISISGKENDVSGTGVQQTCRNFGSRSYP